MTNSGVSRVAVFLEKWALSQTTIQGAGVVLTALSAVGLHQLTLLHAVPALVLGAVWVLLPERDAAIRKPLAQIVQDAVIEVVARKTNTAALTGDVEGLISALKVMDAPAVAVPVVPAS